MEFRQKNNPDRREVRVTVDEEAYGMVEELPAWLYVSSFLGAMMYDDYRVIVKLRCSKKLKYKKGREDSETVKEICRRFMYFLEYGAI